MPDSRLPESDDDRVDALHQVLRSNGVGGPAPFTIQGEISQMGHAAGGVRRRGWRGLVARSMVYLVLTAVGLAVVASAIEALGKLLG